MSGGSTRVLIADDEALIRAGLRVLIEAMPGLEVVGEAADGRSAAGQARALRPDVVLMDIRMPGTDGLAATRSIVADREVDARVLVVTTFDDDSYVFEALRSGASGFVLKDTPPEKLVEAIRVVAAGEALLSPSVTRRLIADYARRPPKPAPNPVAGLTEREGSVFRLVALGRSNTEIARELHIEVTTVKTHVGRLLDKLGARDRVQLVVLAHTEGLLGGE